MSSPPWIDVACASIERAQTLQLAADELGVPVEILLRWIVRIAVRKTRKESRDGR